MSVRMPFGKHKGEKVSGLPLAYLKWLDGINLGPNLRNAVTQALRQNGQEPTKEGDKDMLLLKTLSKLDEAQRRIHQLETDITLLQMTPNQDITKDIFPKWYKEISMMAHPDRGGDTKIMQKINELKDIISTRYDDDV